MEKLPPVVEEKKIEEFYIHVYDWRDIPQGEPEKFLGDECGHFSNIEDAVSAYEECVSGIFSHNVTYLHTVTENGLIDIRDFINPESDDEAGDPAREQQEIILNSQFHR